MFAPLLSALNVAGGGKRFQDGGIAGVSASLSSSIIDIDLLASKLAEANESIPPPIVGVEQFAEVANSIQVIEDLSTL